MSTIYGVDENSTVASVTVADRSSATGAVGELKYFAGTTVPEHCLACDGSAISRTAYPELFAAIGTTYGSGDGSTTFNLPNASGVIYGQVGRTVGASVSAGLPNIQGYLTARPTTNNTSSEQAPTQNAFWSNLIEDAPITKNAFLFGSNVPNGNAQSMYYASVLGGVLQGTTVSNTGILPYAGLYFFDAASYDSTYGNAATVQPEGVVANVCIVYE